jgi:hypothetical protein
MLAITKTSEFLMSKRLLKIESFSETVIAS